MKSLQVNFSLLSNYNISFTKDVLIYYYIFK